MLLGSRGGHFQGASRRKYRPKKVWFTKSLVHFPGPETRVHFDVDEIKMMEIEMKSWLEPGVRYDRMCEREIRISR